MDTDHIVLFKRVCFQKKKKNQRVCAFKGLTPKGRIILPRDLKTLLLK